MKKLVLKAWPFLLIALVVVFLNAALEGIISIYIMKMCDAAIVGDKVMVLSFGKKLFIAALILLPSGILLSYTKGIFSFKSLVSVKKNFIEKIFHKNISEFQKDNNSKYISALTNDMNTIELNYIQSIYEIGFNIVYFIVGFIVIASVNIYALLIGMAIMIINTLLTIVTSKPLQKKQNERSSLFEKYTTYIKEVLGAFQVIKTNNLNDKMSKEFYKKSKDIQYKGYHIDKLYTYICAIQNLIIFLCFTLLIVSMSYMCIKNYITFGAVILITDNIAKLMDPLMKLSEIIPKLLSMKTLINKTDDLLKNTNNYNESIEIQGFKENIKFNDVFFKYDETDVLRNVNLTFEKGEKYLIVGPSGGGKSTLLKLFRKYFNPSKGEILIDGVNLKDIKKESYFKNISNVEQQVFLFEDTIRNNITLYKEYDDEKILYAIEKAGLNSFIEKLPNGLDTVILDNGKNISGGEKSRIAIARGLLREADIIFLDEAFASLDYKVAKEIENTLLSLEDITVINVSHVIFKDNKERYNKVFTVKNKCVS